MYRVLLFVGFAAGLAACGGKSDSPIAPSATTSSISVTVNSPVRMGQTTQVSGTSMLSNGQSQPITSGWQSDATSVATVTDAGLVAGISNGRATIYVVSGGRQGQQVIRVVPDYQGSWSGGLRVTACTQTGIFIQAGFCNEFPVNSTDSDYSLSLAQSGELMTARASFGSPLDFPSIAAPIQADGTSSFAPTVVVTDSGLTLTVDATFAINSPRVGELAGTVSHIWRVPNVSGEARVVNDITGTTRTSTTALTAGEAGSLLTSPILKRLAGAKGF